MKRIKLFSSIIAPASIIFSTALGTQNNAIALEKKIETQSNIEHGITSRKVDRREVLKAFLEKYNSPMIDSVDTFISVADKYNLDYRLLPAISCMESTCGNRILPNSYNAWGWGIYGNNAIYFKSFDEGIETVGKGIYEGYVKKGLDTPAKMAPIYTPPRPGHWLNGVSHFISQMDSISDQLSNNSV